jgi:hypothetical protein
MNYIIIYILLFIILASIIIDVASYNFSECNVEKFSFGFDTASAKTVNFLGKEYFQENIESMLSLVNCPDNWKHMVSDPSSITCIIPEIDGNFDANSVNGCVLWLDANDLKTFTESSERVNTWRDKSASNYIFKGNMSLPNNCPSKMQMTNGKYYLHFDSANTQALSIYKPTGFNIANKNFAMFVVCKMTSSDGTIFSKGSKYNDKTAFPGSIFIQNVNSKLNATIHNESGIGKPLQESRLNEWMILSLTCGKDSSGNSFGNLHINGIKQTSEFKPLLENFEKNYCMVIGGATGPSGYTMKDVSDCVYVKSERKVKLQKQEEGKISVITENCIVTEREHDILYTFKRNGTIKFTRGEGGNSDSVPVHVLMVGGGGGGGYARGAMEGSGGGGAGGVSLYQYYSNIDETHKITIGAGGTSGNNGTMTSIMASSSYRIMATSGGGRGGIGNGGSTSTGLTSNNNALNTSGSGGGGQGWASKHLGGPDNDIKMANSGGAGAWVAGGGGGGGAKSAGSSTLQGQADGGNGGEGYTWWVDSMTYARGGGGGQSYKPEGKPGLPNGGLLRQSGKDGVNPGDGGGGSGAFSGEGGKGQDGVVIFCIKKSDLVYSYIKTYENIETYDKLVCKPEPKQVPAELDQSQYFKGDIAEIIAYVSDNDSCIQERRNIEEKLAIKWDLTKIPDLSKNVNIINAKNSPNINIGKSDVGFIGYNQSTEKYEDVNGVPLPAEVWSYDDNSKLYKINFTHANWNAEDKFKNACNWAKTNQILWKGIKDDCGTKYKIDLRSS